MTRRTDSPPTSSFRTTALVVLFTISLVSFSGSLWAAGAEEAEQPAASEDSIAEPCLALVDGEPHGGPIYGVLPIDDPMGFVEAPMLAARVAAGELPPVSERLGPDVQVVRPACAVGGYGGILSGTRSLIGGSYQPMAKWLHPALTMAEGSLGYAPRLYPNVVREWTISDDDRILTLYLRRGMNWSDGMPVTAEDFRFWHQSVLLNETLTPKIQERYRSAGEEPMTMEVIDTFTVEYRFTEPKPDVVFQWAEYRVLVPQHYLSEYHIDHNQDANDHALEAGYESWDKRFIAYYGGDRYGQNSALSKTPTIDTYVLLLREDDTQTYERNPFYWKIDPDGNQLPYVDHLIILRPKISDSEPRGRKKSS